MKKQPVPINTLTDLFFSFAKISLFTVGGGPAMIPLVMDMATAKKGWLSKKEMMDCLTVCQSLPGGIIINMASYIGRRLCGTRGMLAAAFGAVIPTAVLAAVVGLFLGSLGENVFASGAVQGAKAAAVGLVIVTFFKLGKDTIKNPVGWIAAIAAMIAVTVFHVSPILVIIAGGFTGWLVYMAKRREKEKEN